MEPTLSWRSLRPGTDAAWPIRSWLTPSRAGSTRNIPRGSPPTGPNNLADLPTYTGSLGDYSHVVRVHSGNGPHEQMDGRAVAAFVASLDDVGISTEPRLRFQLIAWFTWATAMLNHRWATPDDVPSDLPLPSWSWEGTEGW